MLVTSALVGGFFSCAYFTFFGFALSVCRFARFRFGVLILIFGAFVLRALTLTLRTFIRILLSCCFNLLPTVCEFPHEQLDIIVDTSQGIRVLVCCFFADGRFVVDLLLDGLVVKRISLLFRHAIREAAARQSGVSAHLVDGVVDGIELPLVAQHSCMAVRGHQVGQLLHRAGVLEGAALGNLIHHAVEPCRSDCMYRARSRLLRRGSCFRWCNCVEQVAIRALHMFERLRIAIHEWFCQLLLAERHIVLAQRIEILLAECLALCQRCLLDLSNASVRLRVLLVNRLLWLCNAHTFALLFAWTWERRHVSLWRYCRFGCGLRFLRNRCNYIVALLFLRCDDAFRRSLTYSHG